MCVRCVRLSAFVSSCSGTRLPILSRLMQAMREGVTANDLARCADDVIGSDTYLDTDDDGDGDDVETDSEAGSATNSDDDFD